MPYKTLQFLELKVYIYINKKISFYKVLSKNMSQFSIHGRNMKEGELLVFPLFFPFTITMTVSKSHRSDSVLTDVHAALSGSSKIQLNKSLPYL